MSPYGTGTSGFQVKLLGNCTFCDCYSSSKYSRRDTLCRDKSHDRGGAVCARVACFNGPCAHDVQVAVPSVPGEAKNGQCILHFPCGLCGPQVHLKIKRITIYVHVIPADPCHLRKDEHRRLSSHEMQQPQQQSGTRNAGCVHRGSMTKRRIIA